MSDDIKTSKFKLLFNLVVTLMPFVCLIYGAYFAYVSFYLRAKYNKTYDDIKYINDRISEQLDGKYFHFDTQYVTLSNILPYDLKVTKEQNTTLVENRFGGNMFFYEALNSEAERTLYYGLINEPEKYKQIYTGVSAYIILLTGLSSRECQTLATRDWIDLLPNFIGIEVSSLENNQIYNGFTRLKTSFIPGDDDESVYYSATKDKGYISRIPLGKIRAKNKCDCRTDSCTFALKLK